MKKCNKNHEGMTISEYQKLAARTINNSLSNDEKINHTLFGLSSEAGEVTGIFQKQLQGHPIDAAHLKKEIGDCMWMLAELCTATRINMDEVCEINISKLWARYPDGFDENHSIHRDASDV